MEASQKAPGVAGTNYMSCRCDPACGTGGAGCYCAQEFSHRQTSEAERQVREAITWLTDWLDGDGDSPYLVTEAIGALHHALKAMEAE